MTVLFLANWYPMRYDAMAGLFVRKHAQAVRQQAVDVHVFHVCCDNRVEQEELSVIEIEGVKEHILYIPKKTNAFSEFRALFKLWKIWHKQYGVPDIVHLNVITKEGLLALWLKRRYGVPYVITEHWSGYLPENGNYKGVVRKKMTEAIARNAAVIMPVSSKLHKAMQQCGLIYSKYLAVPNVVDDFFYEASMNLEQRAKKRILHVSCFDDKSKNVTGIIEATKILSQKRDDFELLIVGTGQDFLMVKELADRYQLISSGLVRFVGEQTPREVKYWFDNSDIFLLFSNYETAAVVLEESLACGVPIVSTPVGIAPDVIDEKTGVLVSYRDVEELSNRLDLMLDNCKEYDVEYIKAKSQIFSFANVGQTFVEQYSSAIENS